MKPHRIVVFLVVIITLSVIPVTAAVKLPAIIGENMVLQRGQPLPIWGWDDPDTQVTVTLGESKATAKAGAEGKWMVKLPAMKAGGPHTLTISGSDTVVLKNILVGEVWLCSGQSNMEWPVSGANNAKEEIAAADHARIRLIKIPRTSADKPQSDVDSPGWKVSSSKTVGDFTAVGYFFGRYLHRELDVPIGLIGSSWGGTRIEPWTSPEGFKQVPALKDIADKLDTYPRRKSDNKINHQSPLALYNGMISPLVPYALHGTIWYQGESNLGEGMLYHEKMKALIGGWRSVWGRKDMPFYFVQLAPWHYTSNPKWMPEAEPNWLADIWEAQLATLSVPHTGMAVTVDIGNIRDIHPKNKQDVGRRLALWALAKSYGRSDLIYSGPLYNSMQVEGSTIRIVFDSVGSGLVSRDNQPLTHFTIAGEDRKFVEAHAEIDGDSVVVRNESIESPLAVRFAQHEEAEPNLSNKEGLPASPFRTDSW